MLYRRLGTLRMPTTLEAVPQVEFHRAAALAGYIRVKKVRRSDVAADAGNTTALASTQICMIEWIKRFHPDKESLRFQAFKRQLELPLDRHRPNFSARIVKGVAADIAVLSEDHEVVKVLGRGDKVPGRWIKTKGTVEVDE